MNRGSNISNGCNSDLVWSAVCALSGINLAGTSANALYALHKQGWSYQDSLAPYSPCRYPPASTVMIHGALTTYGSIQAALRAGAFTLQVAAKLRSACGRPATQANRSLELERLGWGLNCFDGGLSFAGHLYSTYLMTRCHNPTMSMFALHAALGVLAGAVVGKGLLSIRLQLLALGREGTQGGQVLNRWVRAMCAPDRAVALAGIGAGLFIQGAYRLRDLKTTAAPQPRPISLGLQDAFPPRPDVQEPKDSVWLAALVSSLGGASMLSAAVIGGGRLIDSGTQAVWGYLAGAYARIGRTVARLGQRAAVQTAEAPARLGA